MTRLVIASALGGWLGLTLLISQLPWARRLPLAERLRPFAPGRVGSRSSGLFSAASARDALGPLARAIGERISSLLGVSEELSVRLVRVHSPLDPTGFRLRQLGAATAALGGAAALALVLPVPAPLLVLALLGTPLLAFLVVEQQLATLSERWKTRLVLELPVVAEQLAIMLAAGWSLGGALARLADRGSGACAADLQRVTLRIRQGLTEGEALREWADIARIDALDRLVPVLALVGDATDMGRIVGDEARSLRREVHRQLLATIERRNQQVWIPVTFAALLPGILLVAIPFIGALALFSS
jgi:tight adherence protein C